MDWMDSLLELLGMPLSLNAMHSPYLFFQEFGFTILASLLLLIVLVILFHFGVHHFSNKIRHDTVILKQPEVKRHSFMSNYHFSLPKLSMPSFSFGKHHARLSPDNASICHKIKQQHNSWPTTDNNEDIVARSKICVSAAKIVFASKGMFKIPELVSIIKDTYGLDKKESRQLEFEIKTNILESHEFESHNQEGTIVFRLKKGKN